MQDEFKHKGEVLKKRRFLLSIVATSVLWIGGCGENVTRDSIDSGVIKNKKGSIIDEPGQVSNNPHPFQPIPTPTQPYQGAVSSGMDQNSSDSNTTSEAGDVYKTINGTYSITITPQIDTITSGATENIHYEIKNFFTQKAADDRAITYLKFEIDSRYAEFFDPQGHHGNVIEFGKGNTGAKSVGDIAIKTNSKSGQVRINVTAVVDGSEIKLTKTLPITIEKNKSSSMAIVPYATSYSKGLFTQKYAIHVVDGYGNRAKDGTKVQTGVISNPKVYSHAVDLNRSTVPLDAYGKPLYNFGLTYYNNHKGTLDRANGRLILNSDDKIPDDTKDNPKSEILDTLIILPNKNQYKPYNIGGWEISSIDRSTNSVKLYDLEGNNGNVNNVSYVIGNEYRYDQCNRTIMNAAASTFESSDVEDGVAYAELRYTPAMVGKDIFIYANSKIDGKRIGVSRRVTLGGTGLEEGSFSCKNEGNTTLPVCSEQVRLIQKDSKALARDLYPAQPVNTTKIYDHATITKTDCSGWATITIYGIPAGKTATVTYGGDIIGSEPVLNH